MYNSQIDWSYWYIFIGNATFAKKALNGKDHLLGMAFQPNKWFVQVWLAGMGGVVVRIKAVSPCQRHSGHPCSLFSLCERLCDSPLLVQIREALKY